MATKPIKTGKSAGKSKSATSANALKLHRKHVRLHTNKNITH